MRHPSDAKASDHVIVAFLKQDGDFSNVGERLHACYTKGNVKHVQVCFYDHQGNDGDGILYTYSVDGVRGRVFQTTDKAWNRAGWEFYAIPLQAKTRQKMHQKAVSLVGKPYNYFTIFDYACLPMYPQTELQFSCSHLAMVILQSGGLFQKLDPRLVTDMQLKIMLLGLNYVKFNPLIKGNHIHTLTDAQYRHEVEAHPDQELFLLQPPSTGDSSDDDISEAWINAPEDTQQLSSRNVSTKNLHF